MKMTKIGIVVDGSWLWEKLNNALDNASTIKLEQKTEKWIPVSEKPPKVGQSVLISIGGIYTADGCLRDDGDWCQFRWNAIQNKDIVNAWMLLPEPYSCNI